MASVVSVELGITVALLELTFGVIVGNVLHLHTADWLDFVAKLASIVLTFLAGMEVDPVYMRDRAKATVGIGLASFIGPFVVASLAPVAVCRSRLQSGTLCRRHSKTSHKSGLQN